jgi:hypothetical protein
MNLIKEFKKDQPALSKQMEYNVGKAGVKIFFKWFESKLKAIQVDAEVKVNFAEEEHRILKLLLASKIAEIQVNIVYDEPLDQRMGKVKLVNILNDINKKISE